MDTLVAGVHTFPADRAGQEQTRDYLLRNEKIIIRGLAEVDAALTALQPAKYGLTMLILL